MSSRIAVVGGGIIGVSIARELRRRHSDRSVTVLEKEPACGRHASGRNSGVLHAGFYYTADSLKAKFTRDGNRALAAYCDARGLPLNRCGKLVVAATDDEIPRLQALFARGQQNGLQGLRLLSADEARAIEPHVRVVAAVHVPEEGIVDYRGVVDALHVGPNP